MHQLRYSTVDNVNATYAKEAKNLSMAGSANATISLAIVTIRSLVLDLIMGSANVESANVSKAGLEALANVAPRMKRAEHQTF